MPLAFRKEGITYHFPPYDAPDEDYVYFENSGLKTKRRTPSIAYVHDGGIYYAPCLSSTSDYVEDDKFRYTWSSSKASRGLGYNNTAYHLANVRKYKNVKTEGYFSSITYTRTKQSNGYYKVVFTINYSVRACTKPVGIATGSWKIELEAGPTDITYTTAWGGTYSGTTTTTQTGDRSFSCTCTVTCTGGDASTAKDRWFAFHIYSNEVDISWAGGTFEKKVTEAWKDAYNIPAGTYTPSAFRSLIEQYISNNGNRTCSNTFTAKVNGQTITVNSGSKIYYQVLSSSPQGNARSVYFGKAPESGFAPAISNNSSTKGFTNGKAYVVYNYGGGFTWTEAYKNYANYSITIGTGINFS